MHFFGARQQQNSAIQASNAQQPQQVVQPKSDVLDTLTWEQYRVLEELMDGNCVVVDACVGAGKTRVLQAIADAFPSCRVLYLTYNRLLKIDAQNRITNRNATVQNYHGFVTKYLRRRNIHVTPEKQIETFLKKCRDIPLIYDIILVDEYQDLREDTAQLLIHLSEQCPKALWVFVGDMAQKIYDTTRIDVYDDCINRICPDYVPIAFTQSFRISPGLAEDLSKRWNKKIVGVNENCFVKATTNFKEILALMDETPNEDLLVLGPRFGLTQELVNILERHNPRKYNKRTVWTSIADRDENAQIQPGSMIVTTYDGCKGMERKVCVVIDWTNIYFEARAEKPFVDPQIVRNLFCVAASRGKDKIYFYHSPQDKDVHLVTVEEMYKVYEQADPSFSPSPMFAFKHQEDIRMCMDNLEIIDIPQDDRTEIETERTDANIDLTPAIGRYQQIAFFKNYDCDAALRVVTQDKQLIEGRTQIERRVFKWAKDNAPLTPEQTALAMTACDTQLFRYCNQARQDFISPEMHNKLMTRLATHLDQNTEKTEVRCSIRDPFSCTGYMDYQDEKGIPWELKFVSVLSYEHYLQTAMYSAIRKTRYAYLWNVRTNELKKVVVKVSSRCI